MKLYRNAVILIVVVALLVGAYIFLKNKNAGGSTPDYSTDTIKIFDLEQKDIKEITIEDQEGTFVFVREKVKEGDTEKDVWKVVKPEGFKADESQVNSIAINFSYLNADRLIEEDASDLSKYGLDKPSVTSAKMSDGKVYSIEIGDETPTKGGYYAKVKDSGKVYTISSYTGGKLKPGKNGLRLKALFSVKPEDINRFSMERKGAAVFTAEKKGEYDWDLTYPIQSKADVGALSPMLEAVSQASVLDFIEESPSDLGKYGLDKPNYVFEFETPAGKNKLFMGTEKEKGSQIYAKLGDSNEVFTISLNAFKFIDKPLKEIMEVFAYIVNIQDVERITVEMDGRTVNCVLQTDPEDRDKDKFFVDGKDVSGLEENGSQLFRKYYQALIGVTLSEIEPEAQPSAPSEITFTYYLKKDPKVMKVEFVPKDERYYYVRRNGQYSGIVVEKKKFDQAEGVREMYKKLSEAMNKQ